MAEPLHVYRVLQESGARGRLDVATTRGLTPLVGRESEVTLLLERWEQAKAGHGQVMLLSGEAGIGKSRLVQVLKEQVAHDPHVRWECRSLPYYQNTALYPLTDLFQRTLQWQPEETPDEKLGKLEQTLRQYRLPLEETVPLFAPLLSLPISENRYPSGTCCTSAGALHRRRFTLDGPHDPRIFEPGDRADTDDLHVDGTDLSSDVSTLLEPPFLFE